MDAAGRLEELLRSLETLKAPGASGVKIQEITQLCIDNIEVLQRALRALFHTRSEPLLTAPLPSPGRVSVDPKAIRSSPQGPKYA